MERVKPDLHAMIFSGGGADGAYQIGVAKALFNGKSRVTFGQVMEPEVLTGTSIGSFNASFLVSRWDEMGAAAVDELEKLWLERMAWMGGANGGFRVRMNPLDLFDPRPYLKEPFRLRPLTQFASDLGLLSWEALNRTYNLVASDAPVLERITDSLNVSSFVAVEPWEGTIRSIDFKKIRQASKKLRIAATNWALGEVREFKNQDMTDKLGPAAIRASSAVPGFYPPAQVGAQTYVDGAVLMNTPLAPALAAMREVLKEQREDLEAQNVQYEDEPDLVLHVIYMNTDVEKMPIAALQSTLQTLYRTQIIGWANAVNQDIERAKLLNQGLAYVRDLLAAKQLMEREPLQKTKTRLKEEVKKAQEGGEGSRRKLDKANAELRIIEKLEILLESRAKEIERVREQVGKLEEVPMKMILDAGEALVERLEEDDPFRQLTIHRYFPPDGLDGALGFMDVRKVRLDRLIGEGFYDTVNHDCKTNGCVLAGKHRRLIEA